MKNKAVIIIAVLLTGAYIACNAQNDSISDKKSIAKNAIYIEAMGNGFNYSDAVIWGTVNYERTIICSKDVNCSIRMGFGPGFYIYDGIIKIASNYYSLPLLINIITKPNGTNHLEAGLGVVLTDDAWLDNKYCEVGFTGGIKYRYQKKRRGLYISSGLTPSLYFDHSLQTSNDKFFAVFDKMVHLVTIGICVGYHF